MRLAVWMVFLSILAAASAFAGDDRGDELRLLGTQANESDQRISEHEVGDAVGMRYVGLVDAVMNGIRDQDHATTPLGLFDAAVAVIMQRAPLAVCFTHEATAEEREAVYGGIRGWNSPLAFFLGGRWSGAQGTPRALTWSLVPDGTTITSGIGEGVFPSNLFFRMNQFFAEETVWISLFEQGLNRWAELTGLSYTRITTFGNEWDDGATWGSGASANRGDVRISMKNFNGFNGVLAYNYFPSNGDVVFNDGHNWGASANNWRFLRDVWMHEHGHGLGEFHVCSNNSLQLMEPFINTIFDGPQHDDLRGAQRHYGDPFEPDNNAASAQHLGTVTIASSLTSPAIPAPNISNSSLMSLDATGEQDWFQFSVDDTTSILTVTATPRGFTYDSSPQVGGSCTCCNSVNSEAIANLDIEVYESDGVTLLATGASSGLGQTETIRNLTISGPVDYFVRVFSSNSHNTPQFYDLDISIELPGACCRADGSCILTRELPCVLEPGFYQGEGSPCPPDPACVPVDTLMTCELSSATVSPGQTVQLDMFVEEVTNLGSYQATVSIIRTSGTGTVTVPCPDGVRINQKVCITGDTFEFTGDRCDGGNACPDADPPNICISRPDYVFSNMSTAVGAACATMELGAGLQAGSVDVLGDRKYIGDVLLAISPDAESGSTFEITVVPDQAVSFLRDMLAVPIPTQFGAACTLTVRDSSDVDKNRYVSFKPNEPGDVAYKLDMVSSFFHPTAVVSGWVGVPDADGIASLEPNPVTRTWTEPVVHITGCDITPVAEFELAASTDDGQSFLPAIMLRTVAQPADNKFWGDTVGVFDGEIWTPPQGVTNFDDVNAAIKEWQEAAGSAGIPRTDVEPQEPNRVTNFNDVLFEVFAFQGDFYPFGCPSDPCQDNIAVPCP